MASEQRDHGSWLCGEGGGCGGWDLALFRGLEKGRSEYWGIDFCFKM